MNKNDKIGLVLSGGGGKGAYQIGVWKAMTELGWSASICGFSGVSVGALNAAVLASVPEKAEEIWSHVTPLDFLDIDAVPFTKDGLFSRSGLAQIIQRELTPDKLNRENLCVYANATKIAENGTQTSVYFDLSHQTPQQLLSILLASSALPVAYPSEMIAGERYLDGGLTDILPIRPLYDRGFRHIIGINITDDPSRYHAEDFPELDYLEIYPSRNLGHLLDGTLDFSGTGAALRMDIGYHDALRTLKAYENGTLGNADYARIEAINMASDNAAIDFKYQHDRLKNSADEQLNRLEALYKKFDF